MRKKLGLSENEEVEWTYQQADFSPLVRKLVTGGDQTLGAGINGAVY